MELSGTSLGNPKLELALSCSSEVGFADLAFGFRISEATDASN